MGCLRCPRRCRGFNKARGDINDNSFNELTDLYEALSAWPKRLAREEPVFRRLVAQAQARCVLGVACGTGQHAAMFHRWGLSVEGADLSGNMIDQARKHFGEDPILRWTVRSFDMPIAAAEPFDVALCVGNSLALTPDLAAVNRTLGYLLAAVRPGGKMVIQVLNLWAIPQGPCRWQTVRQATWHGSDALITKGIPRTGARGFVEFILALPAESTQSAATAISFIGLESDDLARFANNQGAARIECFGGYLMEPYVRETSTDLLLITC